MCSEPVTICSLHEVLANMSYETAAASTRTGSTLKQAHHLVVKPCVFCTETFEYLDDRHLRTHCLAASSFVEQQEAREVRLYCCALPAPLRDFVPSRRAESQMGDVGALGLVSEVWVRRDADFPCVDARPRDHGLP